jgi:hypothetical protein
MFLPTHNPSTLGLSFLQDVLPTRLEQAGVKDVYDMLPLPSTLLWARASSSHFLYEEVKLYVGQRNRNSVFVYMPQYSHLDKPPIFEQEDSSGTVTRTTGMPLYHFSISLLVAPINMN